MIFGVFNRGVFLAYALWAGFALATAVGSLLPRQSPDHFGASLDQFDKAEHLIAYMCLGLTSQLPFRDQRAKLRAGLAMIVFGALLECLQNFVPGRSCDGKDLAANIAGVFLGYSIAGTSEWVLLQARRRMARRFLACVDIGQRRSGETSP